MSVPLQSVPENQPEQSDPSEGDQITDAKRKAAEIVAHARRQAEAITADAKTATVPQSSPLAALGSNADEIIKQVRKLIAKQRKIQAERDQMVTEIAALQSERDELVQRLTDAVERMEELAKLVDNPPGAASPQPSPDVSAPPRFQPAAPPASKREADPKPTLSEPDTSLAARLREAERAEQSEDDDSSLAARLERAEREREANAEAERAANDSDISDEEGPAGVGADGRSFYDRHSAKLPRLEGDGGRSVLSAMGGMRPESEPKGRKGRRRTKK